MTQQGLLSPQSRVKSDALLGGFFNIDKPAGWTSHDVVAKIRRLLNIKRVGHLGTLDPEATGVLPICFGKGTKLASFLSNFDKAYEAVLRLGEDTDTQDATGKVTRTVDVPGSFRTETGLQTIKETMAAFVGDYMQQPPMYSAVKIKGVPLYKSARNGQVIVRPSRHVIIQSIVFVKMHHNDITFRVHCSKGTYIRTLCADIGKKLGLEAHLRSLRRTRSGVFHLDQAIKLDDFVECCHQGNEMRLAYPLNTGLEALPSLWVKDNHLQKLCHGVQIGVEGLEKWNRFKNGESLRFLDLRDRLLALGSALCDSDRPETLFKVKTVLSE